MGGAPASSAYNQLHKPETQSHCLICGRLLLADEQLRVATFDWLDEEPIGAKYIVWICRSDCQNRIFTRGHPMARNDKGEAVKPNDASAWASTWEQCFG